MWSERPDLVIAGLGLVVAVVLTRSFFARSADLRLSYFRPWRGDPWPIGVQEDDDVRFSWTRPASPDAPALDLVADAGHADPDAVDDRTVTVLPAWVDADARTSDPVTVARPSRVDIHRRPR